MPGTPISYSKRPQRADADDVVASANSDQLPSHPPYSQMIKKALAELKNGKGTSKPAILKYIVGHFDVGMNQNTVNNHLKHALKRGVQSGELKQVTGTGASGSFKLGLTSSAGKPKAAKKSISPSKSIAPKKKGGAKKAAPKPASTKKSPKKAKKSPAKTKTTMNKKMVAKASAAPSSPAQPSPPKPAKALKKTVKKSPAKKVTGGKKKVAAKK